MPSLVQVDAMLPQQLGQSGKVMNEVLGQELRLARQTVMPAGYQEGNVGGPHGRTDSTATVQSRLA